MMPETERDSQLAAEMVSGALGHGYGIVKDPQQQLHLLQPHHLPPQQPYQPPHATPTLTPDPYKMSATTYVYSSPLTIPSMVSPNSKEKLVNLLRVRDTQASLASPISDSPPATTFLQKQLEAVSPRTSSVHPQLPNPPHMLPHQQLQQPQQLQRRRASTTPPGAPTNWHAHVYARPPNRPTPHSIADILGIAVGEKLAAEGAFDPSIPAKSPNTIVKQYEQDQQLTMSDASEEDGGPRSTSATPASATAAPVPLDQPLNLCVAKKSRDSNSSPMPASKQSHVLGKTASKKGKHSSIAQQKILSCFSGNIRVINEGRLVEDYCSYCGAEIFPSDPQTIYRIKGEEIGIFWSVFECDLFAMAPGTGVSMLRAECPRQRSTSLPIERSAELSTRFSEACGGQHSVCVFCQLKWCPSLSASVFGNTNDSAIRTRHTPVGTLVCQPPNFLHFRRH